jgi:hypothetical protein
VHSKRARSTKDIKRRGGKKACGLHSVTPEGPGSWEDLAIVKDKEMAPDVQHYYTLFGWHITFISVYINYCADTRIIRKSRAPT